MAQGCPEPARPCSRAVDGTAQQLPAAPAEDRLWLGSHPRVSAGLRSAPASGGFLLLATWRCSDWINPPAEGNQKSAQNVLHGHVKVSASIRHSWSPRAPCCVAGGQSRA